MKLASSQGISNQQTWEGLRRQTQILATKLEELLNNGINFKDNFQSQSISVAFTAADTDLQIAHQLNIVPTGYLVTNKSVSLDVYNGSSNIFNKTFITLRSSAIGTATIMVF